MLDHRGIKNHPMYTTFVFARISFPFLQLFLFSYDTECAVFPYTQKQLT